MASAALLKKVIFLTSVVKTLSAILLSTTSKNSSGSFIHLFHSTRKGGRKLSSLTRNDGQRRKVQS
jgi:hypothetical protein